MNNAAGESPKVVDRPDDNPTSTESVSRTEPTAESTPESESGVSSVSKSSTVDSSATRSPDETDLDSSDSVPDPGESSVWMWPKWKPDWFAWVAGGWLVFVGLWLIGASLWNSEGRFLFNLYLWMTAVCSVASFVLYGVDKQRALADGRRIPEKVLHIVAMLGGWPGAWFGQRVFRHKTSKLSFQIKFWLIVAVHVVIIFWGIFSAIAGSASPT